jgi:hypothetical protein
LFATTTADGGFSEVDVVLELGVTGADTTTTTTTVGGTVAATGVAEAGGSKKGGTGREIRLGSEPTRRCFHLRSLAPLANGVREVLSNIKRKIPAPANMSAIIRRVLGSAPV